MHKVTRVHMNPAIPEFNFQACLHVEIEIQDPVTGEWHAKGLGGISVDITRKELDKYINTKFDKILHQAKLAKGRATYPIKQRDDLIG